MKKILLFSLFATYLLCFAACKKEDSDPRNSLLGTYAVTATYYCSDCFLNAWTNTYSSTITVSKGAEDNELLFTDDYQTNHKVILNGSSFTMVDFPIKGGGIGTGGGSFGTNSISYNLGTRYGCTVCSEEGFGTK